MLCPIYGCPRNFRDSLTMSTATFPNFFSWAFVVIDLMNVCTKFKVRSFIPVPEIIWGTPKIWAVLDSLDMPTLPFIQNFNGL